MTYESFESIIPLLCVIIGLLSSVFKYVEFPKRTFLYLVAFFVSHFLSDYYWNVYLLTMGSYPEVSAFAAYLGWNLGYFFLLLTIINMRRDQGRRRLNPFAFWPVLTNIPLLFLYIRYGGVVNNIYEVGVTTAIMILCMDDILYYARNKKEVSTFPFLSLLALIYEVLEYVMWTASCFEWEAEYASPYFYCSILGGAVMVYFPWAAKKCYEESRKSESKDAAEIRFQATIQTILSFVIFTACIGGYALANWIKRFWSKSNDNYVPPQVIISVLFLISVMLVAIILVLLFKTTEFYRAGEVARSKKSVANRSKFNLVFTIISTLVMMAFLVIFNMRNYFDASVTAVVEDGENRVKMTAVELENYLTVAESTLRVAADSVSYMEENGASTQDILLYLSDQTNKQFEQFDENFTGIYAYVNGDYMDGSGWVPPEGYDPVSRDWYKAAASAGGEVVIVSPYVDAQTGQVIITIAKSLSPSRNPMKQGEYNVVCLDVIVNHIKEVTEQVEIAGKGYGMVVNSDGFIIAHRKEEYNGKNLLDMHGQGLLNKFAEIKEGTFEGTLDKKKCTVFVSPILDQWYDVIIVENDELFENIRSQLMINIMVSVVTFALISFFYFLGYRNEQDYGKKVEDMNIHVVSALATAIDAKDTYTNGHSSRVAKYSRMIARRIGYGSARQDEIYMMGLLHDVGKIGVPDEVINKPSRLSDEEYELIKKHPVIGSEILKRIKERPELSVGARWHHERYDGKGYPDGLSGEEIPEEARIIAVADAYDAMTSRRSYRGVIPQEEVRKEIKEGMGTQFDPRFAGVMLEMIDEDTDYQMREM